MAGVTLFQLTVTSLPSGLLPHMPEPRNCFPYTMLSYKSNVLFQLGANGPISILPCSVCLGTKCTFGPSTFNLLFPICLYQVLGVYVEHLQNMYFRLTIRKQLKALPNSQSTQSKSKILLSVLSMLESALQPVSLLWQVYRFCR
ncbi:hypothetical protein F5879DRAFT_975589 [Lentinula edodes]|nr:hypothetical protein F5879DRAFT_975589 [Lentinula edodes]